MPRHFLRGTDLQLRDAKTGAHGVIGAALDLVEPTRIRYPLHVESSMACADHSTLFISRSRRAAEPLLAIRSRRRPAMVKGPFRQVRETRREPNGKVPTRRTHIRSPATRTDRGSYQRRGRPSNAPCLSW